MTGFKSKRAAALDEEGMYLVHQTEVKIGVEALKYAASKGYGSILREMKIAPFTIKCDEAFAQPAQNHSEDNLNMVAQSEPVAYCYVQKGTSVDILTFDDEPSDSISGTLFPLYAHPQRPWVGLTEDERKEVWWSLEAQTPTTFAQAIEAKLKEKNT